jgi:hypothetical protein
MREAKGRGWAGPLAAGAALLLALAVGVGSWAWQYERWWRKATPEGEVLVALRFPPGFLKEEHQAAWVEMVAPTFVSRLAPVLRKEGRRSAWSGHWDVRLTVSVDRVPDLRAFADRMVAQLDDVFSMGGVLVVRGLEEEVLREFRGYRAP